MQAVYNTVCDFVKLFFASLGLADGMLLFLAVAFVAFLKYNGQKSAPAAPMNKHGQFKKVSYPRRYADSDMSTDVGDYSTSEFSDNMSSHTDGSSVTRRSGGPAPWKKPQARNAPSSQGSLNPHAATFVPKGQPSMQSMLSQCFPPEMQQNSQQVRESIKTLKAVLEDWEKTLPTEAPGTPTDSNALFDTLAKLSPEQASVVRSMLDSKLAAQAAFQPPSSRFPMMSSRPFKPFANYGISGQGRSNIDTNDARARKEKGPQPAENFKRGDCPEGMEEESLRTQLRDLAQIPNDRVLMLRRINRLGIDSGPPLKAYFSQYGKVDRVMVAPTKTKQAPGQTKMRVRAAPLGFVVFSAAEEARATLAKGTGGDGSDHDVHGQTIGVYAFTSHTIEDRQQEDQEEQE